MEKDFRFLMYNSEDEDISVNAVVKGESVWLTQKGMAELFGCSADNISLHLKNIFTEGELSEIATTEGISVVQQEGSRKVTHSAEYNSTDLTIDRCCFSLFFCLF